MNDSETASKQLALLANLHLVCAIFTWLTGWGLIQIARTTYGAFISNQIPPSQEQIASFTIVLLAVGGALCALHGALMLWVRRLVQRREKYNTIFTLVALNAIIFPVGTLLFLVAFLWLNKPPVRAAFGLTTPQIQG